MISFVPVEDDGRFCEELALNRVLLSTFALGGSIEYGISLCRLILDLERHSPWLAERR